MQTKHVGFIYPAQTGLGMLLLIYPIALQDKSRGALEKVR